MCKRKNKFFLLHISKLNRTFADRLYILTMNIKDKFVVTLNRELGSGGRTVGRKLSERLGVKFYDKILIERLTKEFDLTVEQIEAFKAKKKSWWNEFNAYYKMHGYDTKPLETEVILTNKAMMDTERHILTGLAEQESCVIAGRSAFFIFKDHPNHLNVFIQASEEKRIERLMTKHNMTLEQAKEAINETDTSRETYIQKFVKTTRYDARNYDIVIKMDGLTEDAAADIIMQYIEKQTK